MKTLVAILLFCGLSANASEHNWHRILFSAGMFTPYKQKKISLSQDNSNRIIFRHVLYIPCGVSGYVLDWERPKGAIFCRMEDYLTAKTKVWIKVGVK